MFQTHSSSIEIEQAIAFIRQTEAWEAEALQAIMDGATLAAEQVQDKRLEILEIGPEVSAGEILIEFAITLALESSIIGALVGPRIVRTARKTFGPRIRRKLAATELAHKTMYLRTARFGKNLPYRVYLTEKELTNTKILDEAKKLNAYANFLNGTAVEHGTNNFISALAQAAKAGYDTYSKEKSRRPLNASDTPGVTILSLAQDYMSAQRMSLTIESATLEMGVRTGLIPVKTIYRILESGGILLDGKMISFSETRDYWKRYFELLIWVLLLYDHTFTGKGRTSIKQSFLILKGYVQDSLISYWTRRFIYPATDRPFSELPGVVRPDGKPDIDRSVAVLGQ
jgi:hypothetical protein